MAGSMAEGGEPGTVGPITRAMRGRKGPRSADTVIAAFAARQHGVVTRRQLLASEVGESAVDRRIGTVLHPVHAGVYAAGHLALTTEGRWLAGVLACGRGTALSHRAAAALHGLRPAWRDFVEVIAPRTVKRVPNVIVHRPRSLDGVVVVRGIPVTDVSRTIVDLADVVSEGVLRKVVEQAAVLRLEATPVPIPGRRGYGRLRRVLAELGPVVLTRSELEDRFLALCVRAGLPAPRSNPVVEGMEVDFSWPEHRLIAETDGWAYHGTQAAFARDRRRSAALQVAGWTVVRFTYEDVVRDPAYVTATLRRLLR